MARTKAAGLLLAVLTVGLGLVITPTPASAAPTLAPTMLVLDASGSMKDPAGTGVDKMTAAKQAVHTLVQQAPDDTRLGLTVYGTGTGSAAGDKAAGCKDVKVVQPVGPLDRAALGATVDGVKASGYTPIGEALRVAAAALPKEGPRAIVLVSDGIDSCAPPDPCQVARELSAQGVDLHVHTVGLAVDGAARSQLTCIAQATGGTYTDAVNTGQLATALTRALQRALRSYEVVGTPVTGTAQQAGAPTLVPGAYTDQLAIGDSKYYAIDVPAGYTMYASATSIMPAPGEVFSLQVHHYAADGTACTFGYGVRDSSMPVISATLRWTPEAGSSAPCAQPGKQLVHIEIEPSGTVRDPAAHPLEILIGLEPPVSGDPGPAGTDAPVTFVEPTGPAQAVVGGGSFNSAATLPGSGSYTEHLTQGEMVFYRVRLDWGQGLAYRVKVAADPAYKDSYIVVANSYAPSRYQMDRTSGVYSGKDLKIPNNAAATATPPVRYRNREVSGLIPPTYASVAGWYYLTVIGQKATGRETAHQAAVILDLAVVGTPASKPGYASGNDTFGGQSGTAGSAAGGKTGASSITGKAGHQETALSRVGNVSPTLLVGLPVLLLVGVGGLLTALLLRRRTTG